METRRLEEQGRELDDAGIRMRTASVLKEDKEWEKARAADRIVEKFLKPVRKARLQSHSLWPSRAVSCTPLPYTALCITYCLFNNM